MIVLTLTIRKRKNKRIEMRQGNIKKKIRRKNIIRIGIVVEAKIVGIDRKNQNETGNKKDLVRKKVKGDKSKDNEKKTTKGHVKGKDNVEIDKEMPKETENKGHETSKNRKKRSAKIIAQDQDPKSTFVII